MKNVSLIAAAAMVLPISVAHAAVIVDYEFEADSLVATIGSAISSISTTGGVTPSTTFNPWVTGSETGTDYASFFGSSGAGRSILISLDATGYQDITLGSFYQLFAGNTLAAVNWTLEYSTTGTGGTFTTIGSPFAVALTGNSETAQIANGANFVLPSAANNNSDVVFRFQSVPGSLNFDGATASGGIIRLDNFTINATSIPEPSAALLGALGALGLLRRRRI